MFGIKIIEKNKIENLNHLLKDELSRNDIDEYKLTALVEMGANGISIFPENYDSGLMYAVKKKFYEYLKLLVNQVNKDNSEIVDNAFNYAAKNKDEKAALIILECQFLHFSRKEKNRQTYLMLSARSGMIKVAKQLIKRRANIHAIDIDGKSVLDYAKDSKSNEMIDYIKHVITKDMERLDKIGQKLVI